MFSLLSLILSRNMCKSRRKLRNAKTYPIEVPILQIIFFNVILWTIYAIIIHIWAHIINTVFSKLEFLFSVLGSMFSKNICKLRHKLKNSKNLPELTWSWQNKPWSTIRCHNLLSTIGCHNLVSTIWFHNLVSTIGCHNHVSTKDTTTLYLL